MGSSQAEFLSVFNTPSTLQSKWLSILSISNDFPQDVHGWLSCKSIFPLIFRSIQLIDQYSRSIQLNLDQLSWRVKVSFFFFIVVDFVIHWNETAMGLHVSPSQSPLPPPSPPHVSPSQSPLPPPSPPDPSRSSQCTRSQRLSHASNLGWWSVSP